MIDYSKKSIAGAKAAIHARDTVFCIGTSLLNPAKPFMDLWYRVNHDFPDYKLHLVTFQENHEGILSEIEQLGKKFDFLIGVCDSKAWLSRDVYKRQGQRLPPARLRQRRFPVLQTHLPGALTGR